MENVKETRVFNFFPSKSWPLTTVAIDMPIIAPPFAQVCTTS